MWTSNFVARVVAIAGIAGAIMVGTGCVDVGGGEVQIPGTDWCVGGGVSVGDDGNVEWSEIEVHECIPIDLYGCSDPFFQGDFGGATCQGIGPNRTPNGQPYMADAFSVYFHTSSEVHLVTIEWETDMMDSSESMIVYPMHDGGGYSFAVHWLDPGYNSDGDKIEFKISIFNRAGDQIMVPQVVAELDGESEDVREKSDGWFYASW